METLICQKVAYSVVGQTRKTGCYKCIVNKTRRNYIRYTTYFQRRSQVKILKCKICRDTNLHKILTGKNKQKAEGIFQRSGNPGIKIKNVTVAEEVDRKALKKNRRERNSGKNRGLQEIQEIIEEISEEMDQKLEEANSDEEAQEITILEEMEIREETEIKKETEMKKETEVDPETQETREIMPEEREIKREDDKNEEQNVNESNDTKGKTDSSSEENEGIQPIFYSDMTEEERIEIIKEILREDTEDSKLEHTPEIQNIPPLLNDQAMREVLNSMQIDEVGRDTCERYIPGYIPPYNPSEIKCRVCLINNINIVFIPCRHASICNICAETFYECPMCRAPIQEKFEIHIL